MAVRNLYRQALPFRYLGYGLLAAVVLLLPAGFVSWWGQVLVLASCVLGPVGFDVLLRTTHTRNCDDLVLRVQHIENVLAPALLVAITAPPAIVLAVVVCLAAANVSLAGHSALLRTLLELVLGCLLGTLCSALLAKLFDAHPASSTVISTDPTLVAWWLATLMIAAFTLALSDVGFRLTQRLDAHRAQLQERAQLLGYFVPPGLPGGSESVAGVSHLEGRQWLTVCMVDLVAFTNVSAGLAPETVAQVLDDLLDTVVDEANRTQGTLDKFTGDGALLFFATPDRGGGVASAVSFTFGLLARLAALNDKWYSYGLLQPLQMRVGIAAGYCSLGQCGTGEVRAYTVVGPSVALAERLQAAGPTDGCLLCPVSARLLCGVGAQPGCSDLPPQSDRCERWGELPAEFCLELMHGQQYRLRCLELELKGFSQMRVFRCSVKVPAREPVFDKLQAQPDSNQ